MEGNIQRHCLADGEKILPHSSKVTVVMDNVEMRDRAVALLLAGFVLKLLQRNSLGESVNPQDLRRL